MSPTIKDFLGFVVNPPPGDPTRTAGSDLLPNGAVIAAGAGAAGQVPVSDGLGGYTWQAAPYLPILTSLPASPVDGQIINFLADAANGVVWQFRYRAASASASKWEFVGGPPMQTQVLGTNTFVSTGWQDASGPYLNVPLAGDYDYMGQAQMYAAGQTTNPGAISFGVTPFGSNPVAADTATALTSGGLGVVFGIQGRLTGLAGSQLQIQMQYTANVGGTPTTAIRKLRATPVRVGP